MHSDYLHVTGRIVSGKVFEKQPDKTDPQTGVVNVGGYFIGVAVPKTDAHGTQTKAAMEALAQQAWPGGEWQYPNFASKIKDGDGVPQNKKEGYPGHWIFGFSQSWPFKAYTQNCANEILDAKGIKKGDYVRVPFTTKGNGAQVSKNQTPGMYVNAALIEFNSYGEAIISGPDPAAVMASIGAAHMAAGGSVAPVDPGTPLPMTSTTTGAVMAPGPATGPAVLPASNIPATGTGVPMTPGAGNPMTPGAVVTPAPDFLTPPVAPVVPVATPPAAPVMTAKAAGATYESFTAKGWTDDQMIAQGYMEVRA